MISLSITSLRKPAVRQETIPASIPAGFDEARLLVALQQIMQNQSLSVADLPDGLCRDALQQLQAGKRRDRLEDLSLSATLAKEASEAAINVGWTIYDVGEVAGSAQTIASATEEMAASIAQVADTSDAAGSTAEAARTAMLACLGELQEARQAMQNIHQRTTQIDDRLDLLKGAVAQIGAMASTIAGISAQTNLLALNATIEAARAGPAGRGFPVVAAEVKALSSQTAKSTEEIRTCLGTLQTEMGLIADAVGDCRSAVSTGTGTVAQLGDRVDVANAGICQVSDLNRALADMLSQQRMATQEIAASVQGIAEKAHKTRGEVEAITDRLVKVETVAQMSLDAANDGSPAFPLVRLPANIGAWKRRLACILIGQAPAEKDAAFMKGDNGDALAANLRMSSFGHLAPFSQLERAEQIARTEAERMISAVQSGDWAIGTPAYRAASDAMDDMLRSAEQLTRSAS